MAGARVLVSDKLGDAGLAILENAAGIAVTYRPGLTEAQLAEVIGEYDALVIRSGSKVTAKVIAQADRLKVIGRAGIGVDNVDVAAASRRGIVVMNTPTGNVVTTAEHALSLLMAMARKIPQATASMKAGKWEKSKFEGREVAGKTLGLLGLGNVGRVVADRAIGLKMKVLTFDAVLTAEKAASLGVELAGSVDDVLRRGDVITGHGPVLPERKNLNGPPAIARLQAGEL